MDFWIDLALGPAARFSLLLFALGLGRRALLALVQRRQGAWAGGQHLATLRRRPLCGVLWLGFVCGLALVPLWLAGQAQLLPRWSWLAPGAGSTGERLALALGAISLALFVARLLLDEVRQGLGFGAFVTPLLAALVCATAVLLGRPEANPFSYHGTLLIHLLAAEALVVLLPFPRLSRGGQAAGAGAGDGWWVASGDGGAAGDGGGAR